MVGTIRAIWIEQGDSIDFAKFRSLGLDRIYVDIRPEYNPVDRVAEIRDNGFTAGVYWGAAWGEQNYIPADFARYISDQIAAMEKAWKVQKKSLQVEFQFDYEYHNSQYVEEWLKAWRVLRPLKQTSWTLESWQGGQYTWITKSLADLINNDPNLLVVPQLYTGDMNTLVDSAAAFQNLRWMVHPDGQQGGISESRLRGFYNASNFPHSGWSGFLFTNRNL